MIERFFAKRIPNAQNTADPDVRYRYGKMCGILSIATNFFLFAIKLAVGLLSGSISICADAVNNLTDASSGVVTLLGFRLSQRPPDAEHPYGHGRYEYLSGLAVCFFIFYIGIQLLTGSIDKIRTPEPTRFSYVTVAVLAVAILAKLWLAHVNLKIGKKIHSQTLIATAQDSRNDVLSTSAVLIATLLSHFLSVELDGYIGLAVAAFILYSGVGLVKETIYPLLGAAPDPALVEEIRRGVLSFDGVLGTHDLLVHDYGPGRRFASVHVEMAAEQDPIVCHDVIDNIEQYFLSEKKLHLVVHYDPIVTQDPGVQDLRARLLCAVQQIDGAMSIHDLRVVRGVTHTNLVFDCVLPHDCAIAHRELRDRIERAAQEINPTYRCVIVFEHDYATVTHD